MLSDMKVRSAQPRAKAYKLSDEHQLYLFVSPSGGRLWRMDYRYDGKRKCLSIGRYPLISLAEARAKRDAAKRILADGKDPATVRKLMIEANIEASRNTFEKIARQWHSENIRQWSKRHSSDVLRSFERDVFPSIGSLPIASIPPAKVLEVLRGVESRAAIETAKRILQRITSLYAYAIVNGFAQTDPSEKVSLVLRPVRKKGRQPAITNLTGLSEMLMKVDEDAAYPVTRLALRLLALTAVRPGELRGAVWSEFEDLDGPEPLWRIPAARMKGDLDRKEEIGGDHLVPLVPQSVAIIRAVKMISWRGDLVFPSIRHIHKPMSENAIGYLLNRAGYHGRHVPHGFRASFSTIMNEWAKVHGQRDDREIIDLMLAHIPKNSVEGAYNRAAYMPRRRKLAEIWASWITPGLVAPSVLLSLSRKSVSVPTTFEMSSKVLCEP